MDRKTYFPKRNKMKTGYRHGSKGNLPRKERRKAMHIREKDVEGYLILKKDGEQTQEDISQQLLKLETYLEVLEDKLEANAEMLESLQERMDGQLGSLGDSVKEINQGFNQLNTRAKESLLTEIHQMVKELQVEGDDRSNLIQKLFEEIEVYRNDALFKTFLRRPVDDLILLRDNVLEFEQNSNPDRVNKFLSGVGGKLLQVLQQFGIGEIRAEKGDDFDPEIHQALEVKKCVRSHLDEKVLEELRRGYSRNGSLIRAVGVIVGKYQSKNSNGGMNDEVRK